MGRVVVIGSINMDVVASAPRHPAVGETVLGTDLHFVPGGKGANQAVAAARLGATTALVGRAGADAFGDYLLAFLTGQGVDLTGVTRAGGAPTGTALIVVNDRSENSIVVVPGANAALSGVDLTRVEAGDVVVVQFEIALPVVQAALALARRQGARSILNPAPALKAPPQLLDLADFIVVNQTELASMTGEAVPSGAEGAAALASRLRRRSEQVVIVTLGAQGAVAVTAEGPVRVPGRRVSAVDSTGAGDCFVGALAAALSAGRGVADAVGFANLAASLAVQRFGAGTGMPSLADVQAVAGPP